MKITQRIIAMLLVLVMTWSAFPVTALTATKDMIAGYVTQEDPASTDATDPEETIPST